MDAKDMEAALPELSPDFIVKPDDVHCLVAFADKARLGSTDIFLKEMGEIQGPSTYAIKTRSTYLGTLREPPNYATKNPWRLVRCLDSLENICVSNTHGDLVTIGLRCDATRLHIIVATNDDVGEAHRGYLEKLWGISS